MTFVPRDASDEQVLNIVRGWVDVFAQEDYTVVFNELGLGIRGDAPGPECIRGCIQYYRSPEYYPGVEEFTVTDWRTAQGGNPEPEQRVERYQPNSIKMAGAVSFDLPLNGRWSDLTADFVFFENDDPEGYKLDLEEIGSWAQTQREIADMEPGITATEALKPQPLDAQLQEFQRSAAFQASRFDATGEQISQKLDADAV